MRASCQAHNTFDNKKDNINVKYDIYQIYLKYQVESLNTDIYKVIYSIPDDCWNIFQNTKIFKPWYIGRENIEKSAFFVKMLISTPKYSLKLVLRVFYKMCNLLVSLFSFPIFQTKKKQCTTNVCCLLYRESIWPISPISPLSSLWYIGQKTLTHTICRKIL